MMKKYSFILALALVMWGSGVHATFVPVASSSDTITCATEKNVPVIHNCIERDSSDLSKCLVCEAGSILYQNKCYLCPGVTWRMGSDGIQNIDNSELFSDGCKIPYGASSGEPSPCNTSSARMATPGSSVAISPRYGAYACALVGNNYNTVYPCPTGCTACTISKIPVDASYSQSTCTACASGYSLVNGHCHTKTNLCPVGQSLDISTGCCAKISGRGGTEIDNPLEYTETKANVVGLTRETADCTD